MPLVVERRGRGNGYTVRRKLINKSSNALLAADNARRLPAIQK